MKRGNAACDSPFLNKVKLETAVLHQIQEQILSEDNVRNYIQLVFDKNRSEQKPSAEETAVSLAITDADTSTRDSAKARSLGTWTPID
jgi:hypothetical protein